MGSVRRHHYNIYFWALVASGERSSADRNELTGRRKDAALPKAHANPFDYLTELQKHSEELKQKPSEWMPWLTRGKKLVVLIGQKKALGIAVRNDRTQRRYSGLLECLRGPQVKDNSTS